MQVLVCNYYESTPLASECDVYAKSDKGLTYVKGMVSVISLNSYEESSHLSCRKDQYLHLRFTVLNGECDNATFGTRAQ